MIEIGCEQNHDEYGCFAYSSCWHFSMIISILPFTSQISEGPKVLLLSCSLLKLIFSSSKLLLNILQYFLLFDGLKESNTLVRALNLRLKYVQYSSHLGLLSFRGSQQSCSLQGLLKFQQIQVLMNWPVAWKITRLRASILAVMWLFRYCLNYRITAYNLSLDCCVFQRLRKDNTSWTSLSIVLSLLAKSQSISSIVQLSYEFFPQNSIIRSSSNLSNEQSSSNPSLISSILCRQCWLALINSPEESFLVLYSCSLLYASLFVFFFFACSLVIFTLQISIFISFFKANRASALTSPQNQQPLGPFISLDNFTNQFRLYNRYRISSQFSVKQRNKYLTGLGIFRKAKMLFPDVLLPKIRTVNSFMTRCLSQSCSLNRWDLRRQIKESSSNYIPKQAVSLQKLRVVFGSSSSLTLLALGKGIVFSKVIYPSLSLSQHCLSDFLQQSKKNGLVEEKCSLQQSSPN